MTTETFTLENMFAMELSKYHDVIQEIVASAVKELSIEKVDFSSPSTTGVFKAGALRDNSAKSFETLKHLLALLCLPPRA